MGGEEAFYSSIIRSRSFCKPLTLNYELHKCFSEFFSQLGWDRVARVNYCWSSDSDTIPAGKAPVN